MTAGVDVTSVNEHLQDLAARLAAAEFDGDLDLTAATAWSVLAELNEQTWARIEAQRSLALALTAAQAAVADGREHAADPLVHVRSYLAKQGLLPPKGVSSLAILAWPGSPPPGRSRRRSPRHPGRFAVVTSRLGLHGGGR